MCWWTALFVMTSHWPFNVIERQAEVFQWLLELANPSIGPIRCKKIQVRIGQEILCLEKELQMEIVSRSVVFNVVLPSNSILHKMCLYNCHMYNAKQQVCICSLNPTWWKMHLPSKRLPYYERWKAPWANQHYVQLVGSITCELVLGFSLCCDDVTK